MPQTFGPACSASLCLVQEPSQFVKQYGDVLAVVSGLAWSTCYCLYIFASALNHRYLGVPALALYANIAWEFTFSFIWLEKMGLEQTIINRVWFGFDIIILFQFLYYGWREHQHASPRGWVLWNLLLLGTAFMWLVSVTVEYNDYVGRYTAFFQNAVMSAMFCQQLMEPVKTATDARPRRFWFQILDQKTFGWAMFLPGFLRFIGTLAMSIVFYALHPASFFLIFCFVAVTVFDLVFVTVSAWQWLHTPSLAEQMHKDE